MTIPSPLDPLVDGFGRRHTYLRVSVTERCNLRCRYCMPFGGAPQRPREDLLRDEEIVRVVRLAVRMGVTKVRLTGGEPTVRRGVCTLVGRIAAVPGVETIGMTTNGLLLEALAGPLKEAGLTHLNVSLDTLQPRRFERIARRSGIERVWAGIEAALAVGFSPLKLNVVVMGGVNDDEVEDFAELARDRPLHVRFIEFMPFRENGWRDACMVPWRDLLARLDSRWPLAPEAGRDASAVAKVYRAPGFLGSVGFISSMSEHFCDGCNRIRVTADGSLKSCLFQAAEISLRDAMRAGANDGELERLFREALSGKWSRHPPPEELVGFDAGAMTEIGG